jgi:hypothetical protein
VGVTVGGTVCQWLGALFHSSEPARRIRRPGERRPRRPESARWPRQTVSDPDKNRDIHDGALIVDSDCAA